MKKLKYKLLLVTLFLTSCLMGQNTSLESYINEGLESNLSLRQIQGDYEKSLQALNSARGLFFPNIGIDARYTVAKGGREIEFPVGDLMNPVYSTLNQLTQTEMFPSIENEYFPFFRPKEHETKLSLVQPVFNPQILYNYQIEKEKTKIEKVDIRIYKRELIKEIKTAYYNYQKTVNVLSLIDETQMLLEENMRVSKSLFANDKVTSDVVFRSKADFEQLQARKAEAIKSRQMAQAYFNFLLNRPFESVIEEVKLEFDEGNYISLKNDSLVGGSSEREELYQLQNYQEINNKFLNSSRSANIPTIALAMNYGFQGEEYSFTAEDDFILASVVLRWDLFQGMKNRANIQQAKIAHHQLELKQEEVQKQLDLQIINARYDLIAALKAVEAAKAQVQALKKAFKVVEQRYRNGQALLIEYTDARTAMTSGRQNLIISIFDTKIKEAELERATAAYQL